MQPANLLLQRNQPPSTKISSKVLQHAMTDIVFHVLNRMDEFETVHAAEAGSPRWYGQGGTPSACALQNLVARSGTAQDNPAQTETLTAYTCAGDHVLASESINEPTRRFIANTLMRCGVQVGFYDPAIGAKVETKIRANTKLVLTGSAGLPATDEQEIGAIIAARRCRIPVVRDTAWSSAPCYAPYKRSVDMTVHATTKYISDHAGTTSAPDDAGRSRIALREYTFAVSYGMEPDGLHFAQQCLQASIVHLQRHWHMQHEYAKLMNRDRRGHENTQCDASCAAPRSNLTWLPNSLVWLLNPAAGNRFARVSSICSCSISVFLGRMQEIDFAA